MVGSSVGCTVVVAVVVAVVAVVVVVVVAIDQTCVAVAVVNLVHSANIVARVAVVADNQVVVLR